MAAIRHPLIDLVMNDETSRYIGHMERKCVYLVQQDMKKTALLELLTGQMWDDTNFYKQTDDEIQRIAIDTLKRRLQLSEADAQKLVLERWEKANPTPPDVDDIHTRKFLFGPNVPKAPAPHNIAIGRPIGGKMIAPHYDINKHLQGLEIAAKNREALRAAMEKGEA